MKRTAFLTVIGCIIAAGCVPTAQTVASSGGDEMTLDDRQMRAVRRGLESTFGPTVRINRVVAALANNGLTVACGELRGPKSLGGPVATQLFMGQLSEVPGVTTVFNLAGAGDDEDTKDGIRNFCSLHGAHL